MSCKVEFCEIIILAKRKTRAQIQQFKKTLQDKSPPNAKNAIGNHTLLQYVIRQIDLAHDLVS